MEANYNTYSRLDLLRRISAEQSQAEIARRIGYSAAAVNQVLKGAYMGGVDQILQRVAEEYGNETLDCPSLGKIRLGTCAAQRSRPFAATNPARVKQWRVCQTCKNRRRP